MYSDSLHILVIGPVWPEPGSSAAGRRMMQLLSLFRGEGWKVTFASAAAENEHSADLEKLGIRKRSIRVNSRSFDEFIQNMQPGIVLFDRFMTEEQFGWRVSEQCPEAIRILDTEDLHCLRIARGKAVEEDRPFTRRDLLSEETAKREIASILRSDLSLIISEAEMELLTGLFELKKSQLHYLPFMLEPVEDEDTARWPSFEEREHFVTIGNFRHAPNRDAVRWLKGEIWPLVRNELPAAELHLYGAYASRNIKTLDQPDEGFYIRGRAENAPKVVRQARVCLAPLRFGAGLKGKLTEAMQCGTPSVTTEIGAEGIAGVLNWSGIIANRPPGIAEAAVKLYTDRSAWGTARDNGIRIVNNRFSKEEFGSGLIDRIIALKEKLEEHRLEHFTGELLRHHSTASTRYLSLWIEEKNRDDRQM